MTCLITSALKEKAQPAPSQQTLQGSHDVRSSVEKVKLPKLPLTIFNGYPRRWNTFWDSFKSSIHDHSGLADIDKLKYLQKCLTGEAAETISGLPITNENYKEALELLHKRFGDEDVIITKHVNALVELPKITSCEDLRKLCSLYDKTEATVRSLKGIGIAPSSCQTILAPMIMAKIPQELRLIISRKLSNKWDLQGIFKEFGEELSLREKCVLVPTSEQTSTRENQKGNFKSYGSGSNHSTTSTLVVNNERQRVVPFNNVPFCLFCGDRHYSASCTKVTDPDARKSIIREKKRCFNCHTRKSYKPTVHVKRKMLLMQWKTSYFHLWSHYSTSGNKSTTHCTASSAPTTTACKYKYFYFSRPKQSFSLITNC